ncbi:MAG: hypothetical protein IPP97_08505 [Candidatus Obscuribacter sp.]|jgi:hypothetical protein|nr:hypothetical protein [Candidatus Obscuribacter sp.]MBL0185757.1 hypothetical protein [Candidatus Obscuribacter sp.]MBP6351237.1 hypothetical protein [Candidatus Obscuribacter sp.]MBP6592456.1 hypothetical protein [Candidatus Obscuribacter sp.]MBP7575891.1 hypothetical protein [Candidatus Obscuribacter sp.]
MRVFKTSKTKRTRERGVVTAELPIVLWIVFIVLAFPLMDMATAVLRIAFLYAGVHFASISAARTGSFAAPLDGKRSATQESQAILNQVKNGFAGLSLQNVTTQIVITDNSKLTVTRQSAPLAVPADSTVNTYQIEVVADCSAAPLFLIPIPFAVAGLNTPLTVRLSARQYCENPQGLTI